MTHFFIETQKFDHVVVTKNINVLAQLRHILCLGHNVIDANMDLQVRYFFLSSMTSLDFLRNLCGGSSGILSLYR